ncbi:MAG: hypothetical protein IOC52_05665 [Methylobacterium sp.]|nr:hypothetical protein [Methylobacterium sp.]
MTTQIDVVIEGTAQVIEVISAGPQGPPGPAGASYSGPKITASTTPPPNPSPGDIWIDIS